MADQRESTKKFQSIYATVVVIVEDVEQEVKRNTIRNVWLKRENTFELGLYNRESVDLIVKAFKKLLKVFDSPWFIKFIKRSVGDVLLGLRNERSAPRT